MASGILLQFRRAPLHVLGNLLSLPSLPVVLPCYCLGLVLGVGKG